jgi:NTP pyrophosphatase (non-canonical NTP hydrolase)
MLAPLLVTEDPYAAASIFSQAGWKLEYETARTAGQPRACVSLAMARVVLVAATSRPVDALPRGVGGVSPPEWTLPRGLGVELQLHVPPRELSGLFLLHRATGVAVTDLQQVPTGERGFSAEIADYRFLILAGDPDPDLALIATDPRIAALADGLRQRDGVESLTDTGLRLAESSGEAVHRLRRALNSGLERQSSAEVGEQLAEVTIAAAILARQLGLNLDRAIEAKLGRPVWRAR